MNQLTFIVVIFGRFRSFYVALDSFSSFLSLVSSNSYLVY